MVSVFFNNRDIVMLNLIFFSVNNNQFTSAIIKLISFSTSTHQIILYITHIHKLISNII
jgi:hypothetical protein